MAFAWTHRHQIIVRVMTAFNPGRTSLSAMSVLAAALGTLGRVSLKWSHRQWVRYQRRQGYLDRLPQLYQTVASIQQDVTSIQQNLASIQQDVESIKGQVTILNMCACCWCMGCAAFTTCSSRLSAM
ncbi:hypothetical protein WJX72_009991 [[Myrmecia] bisecta]|uniref:DUF1664 domain-containing protein n=1 Tax=[Myrmecia] bisecta TaxID=41462 RepID=A0AAW1QSG1_9CHLO